MKILKKIGAAFTVAAMLSTMSISALAGDILVPETDTDTNKVQITGATAEYTDSLYEVTLNYSIASAQEGDQITMLAYVFGDATEPENSAEESDDALQGDGYVTMLEGKTRALDQQAASATGSIKFNLAKGDGTGVSIDAAVTPYMLVKLGSDASGVKSAQAFFIDLSLATEKDSQGGGDVDEPDTYTITYSAGTYGEGSVPEGTMADGTAVEGKDFTLPANGYTVPDGYKFAGWKIDGTETVLPAGSTRVFDADVTLVAQWVEDNGVPGDVSSLGFGAPDGTVNNWDIFAVTRYCSDATNPDYAIPEDVADVSGLGFGAPDGAINNWDIFAITRYCSDTANPDYQLPTGSN